MDPAVSIIIPAYNHERFIGPAIESVLGQGWDDFELLVIDDGSTDRTGEIARSYKDSRLQYFYQENQDAFNTLNRGLALARGRYISILNSDDIYMPDRLERLIEEQKQGGDQCLFTDVLPIDADGEPLTDPDFGWNVWHRKNREFYFSCGDLYTGFLKGNFMVTTSNLFMTREAAQRTGKFCSLRYLHDYDFIFRMMLAFPGQVRYLDDARLLQYRIHGGNTLGEAAILGREQDKEVIRKYLLAGIAEECRQRVEAGVDRLVELEQELYEVRTALGPTGEPGIRQQIRELLKSLLRRTL
jgi:glycosyltransferase involved in cell wall biosynthesis